MPPDRDPERTRDQILDAAADVFADKGFDATRMDDVVSASGLSKGTVYWHYKSKEGLLEAVLRRFVGVELRSLERVGQREGSVADGLLQYVEQVMAEVQHLGPMMRLLLEFYALALRRGWARHYLAVYYAEFRARLADVVAIGVERGEFRRVAPADVAIALTGLLEGLILLWVADESSVQIDQHARVAVQLFLDGLRSRPGEEGETVDAGS